MGVKNAHGLDEWIERGVCVEIFDTRVVHYGGSGVKCDEGRIRKIIRLEMRKCIAKKKRLPCTKTKTEYKEM